MGIKSKNSWSAFQNRYCPDGKGNLGSWCIALFKFLISYSERFLKFLYLKMLQNSSDPTYNAKGVALGLFIGFFIPFGLQIAVLIPILYFFRASKTLAVAFTFVTNQITVFFIYPFQCYIGCHLLGKPLKWEELVKDFNDVINSEGFWTPFKKLIALGGEIGGGFFIGGFLLGVIFAVPGYFITLNLIKKHRERKLAKKRKTTNS